MSVRRRSSHLSYSTVCSGRMNGLIGDLLLPDPSRLAIYRKRDFRGRRRGSLSSWVDLGGQVHEVLSGFLPGDLAERLAHTSGT